MVEFPHCHVCFQGGKVYLVLSFHLFAFSKLDQLKLVCTTIFGWKRNHESWAPTGFFQGIHPNHFCRRENEWRVFFFENSWSFSSCFVVCLKHVKFRTGWSNDKFQLTHIRGNPRRCWVTIQTDFLGAVWIGGMSCSIPMTLERFIGHFKSDMFHSGKKSNLSTTFEEDWVEMGSSFKISKDDKKNPSNCMTSKSLEVTIRVFASDILGKKGAHHLSSGKVTWTMKSWFLERRNCLFFWGTLKKPITVAHFEKESATFS